MLKLCKEFTKFFTSISSLILLNVDLLFPYSEYVVKCFIIYAWRRIFFHVLLCSELVDSNSIYCISVSALWFLYMHKPVDGVKIGRRTNIRFAWFFKTPAYKATNNSWNFHYSISISNSQSMLSEYVYLEHDFIRLIV